MGIHDSCHLRYPNDLDNSDLILSMETSQVFLKLKGSIFSIIPCNFFKRPDEGGLKNMFYDMNDSDFISVILFVLSKVQSKHQVAIKPPIKS